MSALADLKAKLDEHAGTTARMKAMGIRLAVPLAAVGTTALVAAPASAEVDLNGTLGPIIQDMVDLIPDIVDLIIAVVPAVLVLIFVGFFRDFFANIVKMIMP